MFEEPRPCERHCKGPCGLWKHHSRFRSRKRQGKKPHDIMWEFNSVCKDCEQRARNEKKNEDRALFIIRSRAETAARNAGKPTAFFWQEMNYRLLVEPFRTMMSPKGACLGCGHLFTGETDIQIEHREPPRHNQDWARLHAQNIGLSCGSCNRGKGQKSYAQWLDLMEERRVSNLSDRERNDVVAAHIQADLFA